MVLPKKQKKKGSLDAKQTVCMAPGMNPATRSPSSPYMITMLCRVPLGWLWPAWLSNCWRVFAASKHHVSLALGGIFMLIHAREASAA